MPLFRSYINDLALKGFSSHEHLRLALMSVVSARRLAPNLGRALFCSRATSMLVGATGQNLLAAIQSFPRDERSAILQWIGRFGPFIEDEREVWEDDLYYFNNEDITNEGLGEAARQCQRGYDAHTLSLQTGNGFPIGLSPLTVSQGLLDDPLVVVSVPSHFSASALAEIANNSEPEPSSWVDLIIYCRNRFTNLIIGKHCDKVLQPQPFSANVARRTIELLKVLNQISTERDEEGALSPLGEELKQNFFIGEKAWFSDEGADNKQNFASEMTFPDPRNNAERIQCFWHGKIKTPQYRIHFEWPKPTPGEPIVVAYIGPKISKH